MISASRRYAWPSMGLALVAAIPIWIHVIQRPTAEPCPGHARLAAADRIGGAQVSQRSRPEGAPPGSVTLEGSVTPLPPGVLDLGFLVQRGFEPREFFGLSVVRRFGSQYFIDEPVERIHLDADGERIPAYWIEDTHDRIFRLRAHALVLDRNAVESAFRAGLRLAPEQLVAGTRPVTLLAFRAEGRPELAEFMRGHARRWLVDAWSDYDRLCGG